MKTKPEKIVERAMELCPYKKHTSIWSSWINGFTTAIEQLEPEGEVYVKCSSEEAEYSLIQPSLPLKCEGYVKKLTPQQPSEGEIEKVWYKYAGVERGFIKWEDKREVLNVMSRARFDAALKELNQKR